MNIQSNAVQKFTEIEFLVKHIFKWFTRRKNGYFSRIYRFNTFALSRVNIVIDMSDDCKDDE